MKKMLLVMVASLILLSYHSIYSQNEISNKMAGATVLEWDYTIRTGDTTACSAGRDTISVLGASDTLVSRFFQNLGGDMSIQFDLQGGTPSIYFVVESAIRNENFADSSFQKFGYLEFSGNGINDNYFTGDSVAVTASGQSCHILVPPIGGDVFRIFTYSSASQSGNTLIKLPLKRIKE